MNPTTGSQDIGQTRKYHANINADANRIRRKNNMSPSSSVCVCVCGGGGGGGEVGGRGGWEMAKQYGFSYFQIHPTDSHQQLIDNSTEKY